MGKIIIITEKPSVAQEYKKVLNIKPSEKTDGYVEGYSDFMKSDVQITWAVGHLISLGSVAEQIEQKVLSLDMQKKQYKWQLSALPILPEKYLYKVNDATAKQFNVIKKLYLQKDIDCIYYAGDSGREGIYIQALIRNQIFKTKPKCDEKVVWIDSFTEESIKNGLKNAKPYNTYQDMIDAGYERAIRDWLIGMNFTEALTLTNGTLVNVGRVMTPTLAMIVTRQEEIDNFIPTDYYGINAETDNIIPKWKAVKGSKYYESPVLFSDIGFKDKKDAQTLIKELEKDKHLTVEKVTKTEKKELAPYLFNLADLQNWCSKKYHISPDRTLEIAQKLYEAKLTTYPRTDARVLSTAVAKDIQKKSGKIVPKKYVNDAKITDHYAIIPTYAAENVRAESVTGLEENVYKDICERYENIFKAPYTYDLTEIVLIHSNGERFFTSFKNVKEWGWKTLHVTDDEVPIMTSVNIKEKDIITVNEFTLNQMTTTAPASYTTGSLILAMEKAGKLIEDEELREQIKTCGIGTSATRAGIIEKLIDKGYIEVDRKQKITPTTLGKAIIPVVAAYDSKLISPEKTAELEQELSDIASGNIEMMSSRKKFEDYITTSINNIKSKGSTSRLNTSETTTPTSTKEHSCPNCKKTLKVGRYGWYCDCGFSFKNDYCGHKMDEKDLEDLLNKGVTKVYIMKSEKKKTTFKAALEYSKKDNKCVYKWSK